MARMREEYRDRERRLAGSDRYSWHNPAYLFTIQQRQRAVLSVLAKHGLNDLARLKILEMGCGSGGVLKEFLAFGVSACHLVGVDLLEKPLAAASHDLPGSGFVNAAGQCLPFPPDSFDLVLQFTALSSILDPVLRRRICTDMLRVVRRDGLILSYDFWLNPSNPQTCGLRPEEIRQYFPGCRFEFRRITLAPPIARRLVRVSWPFCAFLERLKFLNSHYLAVIQPVSSAP